MSPPFANLSFPEMYEQALVGPLFQPWAELVLEDVALAPGDRLFDVACGTGIVARLGKARVGETGKVVGVDVSQVMLAVAGRTPGIDWRLGDAASLPLAPGEQFDAVICQQGMQFFPDRLAAAREMHRALTAGGSVAVSTWRPDDELLFLRELRRVAERHVGPVSDRRHSFGEPGPLEALLRDAGFHDVKSKTVTRTIRFDNGWVFVRLNAMALIGMSGARGVDEGERERLLGEIERDSANLVREHSDDRGLAYELQAVVATGRS